MDNYPGAMTIRWSSIHERLGETPRELDFALLGAAVDAHLTESETLDWKGILPPRGDDGAREFAKDVAAMANTRGGLIVYGVGEEPGGTSAAAQFHSVDNTDAVQRRLRQIAAARIHPMVAGLEFLGLASEDGAYTVLVVAVPRSPDAPHIIGGGEEIGVPFRNGAGTGWMREREIERAYSDRFAGRESERRRLVELVADAGAMLDLDRSAWIVAVARPRTPVPGVTTPMPPRDVLTVLEGALRRAVNDMLPGVERWYQPIRSLDSNAHNPRRGLRRWIARIPTAHDTDARSVWVHVELHDDGAVVLAVQLDGWPRQQTELIHYPVVCPVIEEFAVDFVTVTEAYALHIGAQVSMSYRYDVLKARDLPLLAMADPFQGTNPSGHLQVVAGSWAAQRFVPIVGEAPVNGDAEDLRVTARGIALDVLNQFGVTQLRLLV
jgi:hypothetical protein